MAFGRVCALEPAPNIILLLADDQDWPGLSCSMHPEVSNSKSDYHRTPNIDGLAAQGMRFSSYYAPAPVCSPTRASIQTGQNPARLRWTKAAPPEMGHRLIEGESRKNLSEGEVTIAEVLRMRGYATAHYGKWHLGGGGPSRHGYDESDGDTGNRDADKFVDPNPVDIFGMGERAARFMERQVKAGRPFYLQMSYHALHRADHALKTTRALFDGLKAGRIHWDPAQAAITADLDTGVGRLLGDVERLGLAKTSFVIYTSDNGGGGRSEARPLNAGKGGLWEGGIRVPMIVRGPGVEPGAWSHVPAVGYDFFPTFCRLAGVSDELPKNLDGGDFSSVLFGKSQSIQRKEEGIVFHFPHYQGDAPHSAVRFGDYKLIHFYEGQRSVLFDLSRDLGERKDIAGSSPELATRLSTLLSNRLVAMSASMPRVNPDFDPSKEPAKRGGGKGGMGKGGNSQKGVEK
jgi:arylsulfatase A-like enzyme